MWFMYNIFDNNTEVRNTSKSKTKFYPKMNKRQFSKYNNIPKKIINNRNNFQKRTLRY
jgi:hypothetical protein